MNFELSNVSQCPSPIPSPTKVLRTLDLLSINNGRFTPNRRFTAPSSGSSSITTSPMVVRSQKLQVDNNEYTRRNSVHSSSIYEQSISDEFSQINLTINEKRRHSLVNFGGAIKTSPFVPKKHMIFTKTCENKVVVSKFCDDNSDDEIEIIDLNDEVEYYNSFKDQNNSQTSKNLYPNCDVNVWLRSCIKEVADPIQGKVSGKIPKWLNGNLLRNGPGSLKVGEMSFNHLFDSAALLHRFCIKDGNVTYQSKFLRSDVYKKNLAANRIVVSEFGTSSVPDPCQTIFQKISALFKPGENNSDNAMISVYPFGDKYFAFTESPIIHQIDDRNLDTVEKINLSDYIGIINHTSHPHVMADGTVYNLGQTVTKTGPMYNIICFPKSEDMFEEARVVATIPVRWKLHPGYMHTFGITEHYFIIVEQPLTVSVPSVLKNQLLNEPMISSLKWFPEKLTYIYLIERNSGVLKHTFQTESFFYLHIINQYEIDDHVILDICCYKDPEMLNCMYIDVMKNMQNNPDYAKMFRGRPLRFILPLIYPTSKSAFGNIFSRPSEEKIEDRCNSNDSTLIDNLVKLRDVKASAYLMPDGAVYCKPELLCDMGCETPRIFYEKYNGKNYQFFYAISSDVDADNPGTLIKVDILNRTRFTWCEENCYPSEPIFVASPDPQSEDDGVIIAAMVWGKDQENRVGLICLCAKTMEELGRCEFETSGPVPKCLHGWFAKEQNNV